MEIEKKTLRLAIREQLAPPSPEATAAIIARLLSLDCWRSARTILAYHPLAGEVDLLRLLAEENAKEWIFPRVDGDFLSLHRWTPDAPWLTGPFGIREPDPETWPVVGFEKVDLALIPALAFDREGNRLGRGKGYYDRLMGRPGFWALRIGIVTERFLMPGIPTEPHDIGMDLVVTESALHIGKGSRLDIVPEKG
jgi:5-formyltetrahydrofolate cyclo-ligase